MKQFRPSFAVITLFSAVVTGCSSTSSLDAGDFPYFGEVTPKSEIIDATLVDTPPPPPAIWSDAETGVQHLVSGATCPTDVAGFQRTSEQDYPGLPRGYDVACAYSGPNGAEVKLHLTHFGRDVSPDAHLKGVDGTIAESYAVLGRIAPPPNVFGQTIATHRSGFRLRGADDDAPLGQTVTWLEVIDGWHVKVRATYVETEAAPVGVFTGELFETVRGGINDRAELIAANLP